MGRYVRIYSKLLLANSHRRFIIVSREALAKWKNDYPAKPVTNDMPVFIAEHQTARTHGSVAMQLRRLAKRAGVRKHITPHISRHSRITRLIKEMKLFLNMST